MAKIFDIGGRELEEGDVVVLQDVKVHSFRIQSISQLGSPDPNNPRLTLHPVQLMSLFGMATHDGKQLPVFLVRKVTPEEKEKMQAQAQASPILRSN